MPSTTTNFKAVLCLHASAKGPTIPSAQVTSTTGISSRITVTALNRSKRNI